MNYNKIKQHNTKDLPLWQGKRYFALDAYLKNQYHEKIYRISLQSGLTCPNRDGTLHTGGCIFCSSKGSGDFAQTYSSISAQLAHGKKQLFEKRGCKKFIAYFQSFTNTYGSLAYLEQIFMEALLDPDVLILSIATRPDCLAPDTIDLLDRLNRLKPVWIELGLQTIHEKTHRFIRSGFLLEDFRLCTAMLRSHHIPVITHVILGLPGESKEDMTDTIRYLAHSTIFGIKLQLLHILSDTELGKIYKKNPFPLFGFSDYCDFVIDCLELLPASMVIHRLTGDGPKDLLVAPLWSTKKLQVLNQIHHRLKERNTYQGKYFNPDSLPSQLRHWQQYFKE